MSEYILHEELYMAPTPAGAYYCCASPQKNPGRDLLQHLLQLDETPRLSSARLVEWTGAGEKEAHRLLYHLESQSLIQGLERPRTCPSGSLEEVLPGLLPALSDDGKSLLADDQGFYVASSGFPHEAAEELAALSADLGILHRRHTQLLANNLGYRANAWTLGDAAGNSEIGFWPLFIGQQRFSLVIEGIPRLDRQAFTQLAWTLGVRYGT